MEDVNLKTYSSDTVFFTPPLPRTHKCPTQNAEWVSFFLTPPPQKKKYNKLQFPAGSHFFLILNLGDCFGVIVLGRLFWGDCLAFRVFYVETECLWRLSKFPKRLWGRGLTKRVYKYVAPLFKKLWKKMTYRAYNHSFITCRKSSQNACEEAVSKNVFIKL